MLVDLELSFWLLLPLIFSGIAHMIIVKKNYFSKFTIPLHHKWFGENKTWRGFIVVPLFTILGLILCYPFKPDQFFLNFPMDVIKLGFLLGMAYMLFELPNSFIKRRLSISAGKTSTQFKYFFIWLDHTDSALGCILVYMWYLSISLTQSLIFYFLGILFHFSINYLLYLAKIRKNPI
jgi:hypothetical protein